MTEPLRRWQDIAPADATGLDLSTDLTITAPLTMDGERCPWPWEPQQLVGVPMGQYHCSYCGEMVVAGIEHLDYGGDDEDYARWIQAGRRRDRQLRRRRTASPDDPWPMAVAATTGVQWVRWRRRTHAARYIPRGRRARRGLWRRAMPAIPGQPTMFSPGHIFYRMDRRRFRRLCETRRARSWA